MMVFEPEVRLAPLTASAAVPVPESVAVPKVTVPAVNVTDPVGMAVPEAAFTVAVTSVLALDAMLVGLAATVVVVATGVPVTTSVMDVDEAVKPVTPA